MPIEIRTFACAFRCGRTGTHRARIAKHETRCARNPARRACRTCQHNVTVDGEYLCALDLAEEVPFSTRIPADKIMAYDCSCWEMKGAICA